MSGSVNDASAPEPSPTPKRSNGHDYGDDYDDSASPEPAKKKHKSSTPAEDADARLAAQLQEQENNLARGRTTRGGGDRPKKRKAPRKKSSKKVHDDDDSDAASADSAPKRKAGGGFQKPFNLSDTLSVLCGETQVRFASFASAWPCCRPRLTLLAALPPAGRQAAVGAHQGQRPSGSGRSKTDSLRRQDAGSLQATQSRHVQDEQGDWPPLIPGWRGVVDGQWATWSLLAWMPWSTWELCDFILGGCMAGDWQGAQRERSGRRSGVAN